MPLYEYQCDACSNRFEVIQKFSDPPAEVCRICGKGPVRRLMSSPAIQFKGSGWYITDYAKKGGSDASKGGAGKDGESKSAESKGGESTSAESAGGESKSSATKSDSPAATATSSKTKD